MSKDVKSTTSCVVSGSTTDSSSGGTSKITGELLKRSQTNVQGTEKNRLSSNTLAEKFDDCIDNLENDAKDRRCTHIKLSGSYYKLEEKICSSISSSSIRAKDNHYLNVVKPDSISRSLSSLGSDEIVEPYEDEEYASVLAKGINISNFVNINETSSKNEKEYIDDSEFEVIPLTDIFEESTVDENESPKVEPIPSGSKRSSRMNPSVPRMTTSDSFISMTRRYLQGIGKDKAQPTEMDATVWQQQNSFRKLCAELQQKSNTDSDQTLSSAPVSIFENDQFKQFTDSNEEDIIETIKPLSVRKKSTTGRVEFKKGIELKKSSLMSVSSTVCRICHTNTVNERLLSPCYCKGSLAYVHLSCLERWLNQSSRSYCELCLYQYNAVETLRYGFFEGIRLWIRHPRNRNHVRSDCLIAFLLTVVTFGLLVICFIGMDYFMVEGVKLGMSKMWTKSFIVSFLGIIMMGYIVTIYLIVKDQFVPWYTWWKNTLNIRLLLSPAVTQNQRV